LLLVNNPLTVSLRVTDVNGCENEDSITVNLHPAPVMTVSGDTTICFGDSTTLMAGGMNSYLWTYNQGSFMGDSRVVTPPTSTTYSVTGTDANGCEATEAVTIFVQPPPVVDAGPDVTLFTGQTGTLSGNGGVMCQWVPTTGLDNPNDCFTEVLAPADSQQYILFVTDAVGCAASDTLMVYTLIPERPIVPNIFSPNGDGQNDYFHIPNLRYYELLDLQVYNRWGQMIYTTNQNLPGWDGTIDGQPAPMDTYIYLVTLRNPYGIISRQQGNVILLR
jgi:gliding motility-associated-like protein